MDRLERAVELAGKMIMASMDSPGTLSVTVDSKKPVSADPSSLVADLFVRVEPEDGGPFVCIFECRHGQQVSRGTVADFAEKMQVTEAAWGYLLARDVPRIAAAEAKREPRIVVVEDGADQEGLLKFLAGYHSAEPQIDDVQASTTLREGSEGKASPDTRDGMAWLEGEGAIEFEALVRRLGREAFEEWLGGRTQRSCRREGTRTSASRDSSSGRESCA